MKIEPVHNALCDYYLAEPRPCTCGLDDLRDGYQGLRDVLEDIHEGLEPDGCNCGDDSENGGNGTCLLCLAGIALDNYPRR